MLIKVCGWKCYDLGLLYCLGLAVQHRISTLVLVETPWKCETLRRLKFSQKWTLLQDPNYSSKSFKEWMSGKEGSGMGKSKLNLNPIKILWDDLKWADSAYGGKTPQDIAQLKSAWWIRKRAKQIGVLSPQKEIAYSFFCWIIAKSIFIGFCSIHLYILFEGKVLMCSHKLKEKRQMGCT